MYGWRCGRPGWCWPSGRDRQTMAQWDYSAALVLQVAAWTTLQFRRLRNAVKIASLFLERALHSMLSFNAAPRRNGSNCTRVRRILRRRGWGECGLCGLGSTVHLCLPPGDGGAAGRVGAVAVWRQGGGQGGSLGAGAGERRRGKQGWWWHGLMVGAVGVLRTTVGVMARHCQPFPRSHVRRGVGGGADVGALASLAIPYSLT